MDNVSADEADDEPYSQTTFSGKWNAQHSNDSTNDTFESVADDSPESDTNLATPTRPTETSGKSTEDESATEPSSNGGREGTRSSQRSSQPALKPLSTHARKHSNNRADSSEPTSGDEDQDSTHSQTPTDGVSIGVKVRRQDQQTRSQTSHTGSQRETDTDTDTDYRQTTPTGDEVIHEICPECESQVVQQDGDQYCDDCGLLISDQEIDPGPDWREYNSGSHKSKSRVGRPVKKSIHDKGLSTQIGGRNKDAKGNPLSARKQQRMGRLRKWDKRFKVKDTQERNLKQAFGEINRLCSEMELADYIKETACTIYRRAHEEELLPGRSIEAVSSASVHAAMRQAGIPKTLASLVSYCRVERSRITAAYTYISRELGMKIEPPDVTEHLSRVSSQLDVTKATERKAKEMIERSVEEKIHSGKMPSGMAASAVYAATLITRCDRITQQEASDAGDVCELTIRTRHRELLDLCGFSAEDLTPPAESKAEQRTEPVDPSTLISDDPNSSNSPATPSQITQ